MLTNDDGETNNYYVSSGMEYVTDYYGYNFNTMFETASWNLTVYNIYLDRPFVMGMADYPDTGVDHAVCVYGYDDTGNDYIRCFNTWEIDYNFYIAWNDWSAATMHDVHP
ncbi:MAG: hypothetical protein Q7T57_05395 [Dehalococcoidales bacterium]|nr:hypothetical protein [Dehalococcoidales bacterium]